ncbi:MAG: type II toxin-antitoxin system HicB family antitoxin [Gammaproteobacteria bacterium]|nr:type II toxin-antitoxin system HicB family antitoxin [Gammaproteobacteria bacterium]
MLYPVYVHPGDENHAHGVTLPDFPGCFAAADEWDALPDAVQEALELYVEGEDIVVPPPTPLEKLAADPHYQDGVWMLLELDLSRLRPRAVRVNISLPDSLVRRIDDYVGARHLSRSGFLAQAAEKAMKAEESDP